MNKALEYFKIMPSNVDSIFLLTMPRTLGLGFNPVSFWLCFNSKKLLCAVLAEVNNTFGERHCYLCFNPNMEPIKPTKAIKKPKVFHVSPFCKIVGDYEFRFDITHENIKINIDYYTNGKKLISTSIKGKRTELVDKNLFKHLISMPLLAFKVLLLIHYHALRLWLKKIPYLKKPDKLEKDIT